MSRTPRIAAALRAVNVFAAGVGHAVDDELPLAARALEDFRDHGSRPEVYSRVPRATRDFRRARPARMPVQCAEARPRRDTPGGRLAARRNATCMKLLVVVGTRPEAIKMAPVIRRLRREPEARVVVCATAQHREMLDQVFALFGLTPDIDLDLMRPDQTINALAARVLAGLDDVLARETAGLAPRAGRHDDRDGRGAGGVPSPGARRPRRGGAAHGRLRPSVPRGDEPPRRRPRLRRQLRSDAPRGAGSGGRRRSRRRRVFLTGNTVVDALEEIAGREGAMPEEDLVLITAHRRESFGEPLERVVRAIGRLAGQFPATRFVHVIHPNPNVRDVVRRNATFSNVELVEPLDYLALVRLMRRARLILTDSGGIQEEAPTFGKPVLVLREKTERPEGVEAGLARLVGTDEEAIVGEAAALLSDGAARRRMTGKNPYGDGRAAERIAAILMGRPFEPFGPPA